MQNHDVAIFKRKEIRRIWHNEEWYFSVIDIVEVLTKSSVAKRYWSDLKIKIKKEGYAEVYEKIVRFTMSKLERKNRWRDSKENRKNIRQTHINEE